MRKTKEQRKLEKQIKKIYEKYPEKNSEVKDWNKGGFVNDNKFKQPIKHKLFK